ncbi:MAG: capsular polysaccharide biosynthesis protein [Bacteroidia bacterium]|nr:MAG: capsular polysaccharide biosynthesis protein [Bacteroidia bacterium]
MGIFSFFKKKENLPPADLSKVQVDIHSHLIPGIDDGAKTIEDSIRLLQRFVELGFKKVITTPHIMSDFYRNTPEIILSGLEKLRNELSKQAISIDIEAAAEYYLDYEIEKKIERKGLLTLGGKYVLFELPFVAAPDNLYKAIFDMQMNGYIPILAHPERYSYWYRSFDTYYELKEKGVLFQLNTISLTGHYSPETKKIAERMIDENLIDFIGSDCHHLHHLEILNQARTLKHFHMVLESGKLKNKTLL